MTGPALAGLEDRHKWADHKELLAWINNPAAYMAKDPYTQGLKAEYGSMMTGFSDVTLKDVDDMVAYIKEAAKPAPPPPPDETVGDTGNQNALDLRDHLPYTGYHCPDPDAGEQQPEKNVG